MVSTIITKPAPRSKLDAQVDQIIQLDVVNLVAGFFDLANEQYYMAPQTLDATTRMPEGHQHVTVQKLDGSGAPPDPKVFAFFKGINNAATDPEKRLLQATIPARTIKEEGTYRICSITGADAHQPLLMPVIARGSQDDCIRVLSTNTAGDSNTKLAVDSSTSKKVTSNDKKTNVDIKAVDPKA
ncbi:hypothetical protein HK105_208848 [Polyrhizophydium stewartii]|uniref:Uncharacterized protein n=1 Tax=Polyrhizophydium stewartii TaxID=2732419 RepID=A0ABR4MWR5_9FUNG|nr:hypothetical protein HK105_000669 [Polyrhizophydium stewartii]